MSETFMANIIKLMRSHGYTVTPPDAATPADEPPTYSAAEAWEKMEQGWVVNYSHLDTPPRCYMRGDGLAKWGDLAAYERDEWLHGYTIPTCTRFTLHGIHPDAHKHALQRLKAAGLKVGSVVEVVDVDGGESLKRACLLPEYHAGKRVTVTCVDGCDGEYLSVEADSYYYPAHCLRLIEAEPPTEQPYTPPCEAPDGFEWAECEGYPRQGDRAWKSSLGFFTASFDWRGGKGKAHILRKLPKTWKPGDMVWVEVEVVTGEPDSDGEIWVKLDGGTVFIQSSALRETPGGSL